MYEATLPGGISAHAFRAQKFVDISDTIDCKMASLACYETQLERYGPEWLEAIRGRAAYRGFQIGRRYAEAFQVVKDDRRRSPTCAQAMTPRHASPLSAADATPASSTC